MYTATPATTRAAIAALNDTTITSRGNEKLLEFAKEVLDAVREQWEDESKTGESAEVIFSTLDERGALNEIADSAVPIANYEILALAAECQDLATTKPELGPAFDGEPTPTNIIAANIYELAEQIARAELEAIRDEEQELEDEIEED